MKLLGLVLLMMMAQGHVAGSGAMPPGGYDLGLLRKMHQQVASLYGKDRTAEAGAMVPILVSALESSDEEVVLTAADTLNLFGCHARGALPALRAALSRFEIHAVPLEGLDVAVGANGSAYIEILTAIRKIEADTTCT